MNEKTALTSAMEDYLEMIYRLSAQKEEVRVGELSAALNVKPSSVTKMICQLSDGGYINSKKYGFIHLTDKGAKEGEYLLYRHNVIHSFLCLINGSENELEQAEKIEHFFDKKTVENLDKFIKKSSL